MNAPIEKLDPNALRDPGKFAPKLTFADRCAVLALKNKGVGRNVLAIAFDIDRRTVTHICNPHGLNYKNVRAEESRMGAADFALKYLTEDHVARVNAALRSPDATKTDAELQDTGKTPQGDIPNPHAKRAAGVNPVTTENTTFTHRIEVQWLKAGEAFQSAEPGWYWRDLDGDEPDMWVGHEASLMSSSSALASARESIVDIA